ncbi:putative adaptin ear-binding coat-associated protein 1 [Paratrimastix pyriformis]|uniref:Adaptin ear-binding coat-associated protein 1 n=1 Tax=Paratrimastix pyriformis TaxID=342808 RepID=A0ABQ8U8V8_9EUKA|nr:putative adaptin ear-binding coat-associated protein 1 [Paratrimastix pyriformis]
MMAQAEAIEHTLTVLQECFVYKIGPRPAAAGYKCSDWGEQDFIWTGRVSVLARGDQAFVKLEDPNTGELFAMTPVHESGANAIERCLDSSRYFVLRIEDGQGHHAYIGLGFEARADAYDFIASISDHFKRLKTEREAPQFSQRPAVDYSLRGDQKIQLNLKLKAVCTHWVPAAKSSPLGDLGSLFGALPASKPQASMPNNDWGFSEFKSASPAGPAAGTPSISLRQHRSFCRGGFRAGLRETFS